MKKSVYTVCEYQSFVCERKDLEKCGYRSIDKTTFDNLENFILSNNGKNSNPIEIMGVSARKNIGKILTAKNYVGIISMKDGTTIEILPKIAMLEDHIIIKHIFIEMLRVLHDFPSKSFQTSKLDVSKLDIFEIFIRMFIDELYKVVKSGLRSSYNKHEENLNVCKGKIKFKNQLRNNIIHKEHFYVEFNEFSLNRAENRLIKSTLQLLLKTSNSAKNKKDLIVLNNILRDISPSIDYRSDLSVVTKDRNMADYAVLMQWCEIFLTGHSFTSFCGSNVSMALLFPMETLFEQYIATKIKKLCVNSNYSVSVQDRGYYLFENRKVFALRPDIVITRKNDNMQYIFDTKWKILSDKQPNYGISQDDMYQMYAYCKKYINAKNTTLVYPNTTDVLQKKNIIFATENDAAVKVTFVDLKNIENDLNDLLLDLD